jgi:hypothetical protein
LVHYLGMDTPKVRRKADIIERIISRNVPSDKIDAYIGIIKEGSSYFDDMPRDELKSTIRGVLGHKGNSISNMKRDDLIKLALTPPKDCQCVESFIIGLKRKEYRIICKCLGVKNVGKMKKTESTKLVMEKVSAGDFGVDYLRGLLNE